MLNQKCQVPLSFSKTVYSVNAASNQRKGIWHRAQPVEPLSICGGLNTVRTRTVDGAPFEIKSVRTRRESHLQRRMWVKSHVIRYFGSATCINYNTNRCNCLHRCSPCYQQASHTLHSTPPPVTFHLQSSMVSPLVWPL